MLREKIIAVIVSAVVFGGIITGCDAVETPETEVPAEETQAAVEEVTALSNRTMRDLTEDDLIISLGTDRVGGTNSYFFASVINGTVRLGDEVRLVGLETEQFPDVFGGEDHASTTVTGLCMQDGEVPVEEASAGDRIFIEFDGIDPLNVVYWGMVVVHDDSDLACDAVGCVVTVTLREGCEWPVGDDESISVDYYFGLFGDEEGYMTNVVDEWFHGETTLLERDGDTLTLLIRFTEFHCFLAPGFGCGLSYPVSDWAYGYVDTVYLEENS
jgi:hypothetical protein